MVASISFILSSSPGGSAGCLPTLAKSILAGVPKTQPTRPRNLTARKTPFIEGSKTVVSVRLLLKLKSKINHWKY